MPHRKTIKHYHEPGDFHELTFSCYRRMPLLTNDAWRGDFARGLVIGRRGPVTTVICRPSRLWVLRSSTFILIQCDGGCASRRWIGGGRVRGGMPPRQRLSMPICPGFTGRRRNCFSLADRSRVRQRMPERGFWQCNAASTEGKEPWQANATQQSPVPPRRLRRCRPCPPHPFSCS